MIKFIIYTIVSLFSTFGIAYLYCKFTNAHFRFNFLISVTFIIGVLFLSSIKYFNLTYISVVSYFLFFPFLFYFLNRLSIPKFIFYIFIIYIYGMFLDLTSMLIVTLIHNFFYFDMYSKVSQIISSFIIFIIFIIVANNRIIKKFTNDLYKKIRKINYFDFALISFAIFILLISVVMLTNLSNLNMIMLSIIIVFLLTLSFILLVKVRINLAENNIFLNLLKKNNDFYIKVEDENRIFKHNLMAKMLSIKSVSGIKARKLIDDFLKTFNNNMDFSVHIQDLPYGLNGIIYEKIYPYIGKIHIKIDNKINFDIFSKLKPRRYNVLVEKIVIALDNAIESCKDSVAKVLIVNMYFDNDNIVVEIKNTFFSIINIEEIGKINYSTKGKRRGLGLFSALRDNEVKMSVEIVNDWFVSKIVAKQNLNVENE